MDDTDSNPSPIAYTFGQWQLSVETRELICGEQSKTLEPLVFDLLLYFVKHSGKIVLRQDLVNEVWKQGYVDDNAINRAMSELRKHLSTQTKNESAIKTHYKKGYSFVPEVKQVFESSTNETEQSVPPVHSSTQHQSHEYVDPSSENAPLLKQSTRHTKTFYILSVLTLFFVGLLLVFFVIDNENNEYVDAKHGEYDVSYSQPVSSRTDLLFKRGLSIYPIASQNQRFVAYSHQGENEQDKLEIFFKDLSSQQDLLVVSHEDQAFPVAIDDGGNLVYQTMFAREGKHRCSVWYAPFSRTLNQASHQKLFDCEGNNKIFGALVNDGATLIYTKTNYRNNIQRSALFSRNLISGDEYQITSPSMSNNGDRFVAVSPDEKKLVFFRDENTGGSIYLSDLEGSKQQQLIELDYIVSSIRWNIKNTEITWLNPKKWELNTLNIETNKLSIRALNYDYAFNIFLGITILSEKRLVFASNYLDHDIFELETNSKQVEAKPILNSFAKEFRYLPLDTDDHGVYIVLANTPQLWSKQGDVRTKIFNLSESGFKSLSRSVDGNKFLIGYSSHIQIYDAKDYSLQREITVEGDAAHISWLNQDELILIKDFEGVRRTFVYSLTNNTYRPFSDLASRKVAVLGENLVAIEDFDSKLHILDKEQNHQLTLPLLVGEQIHWVASPSTLYFKRNINQIWKMPLVENAEQQLYYQLGGNGIGLRSMNLYQNRKELYFTSSKFGGNTLYDIKIQ